MSVLPRACRRCGGDLAEDREDGVLRCLQCGRAPASQERKCEKKAER